MTQDVTPAGEFRQMREQGEVVTLPLTQRKVRIRVVKPGHLLKLGRIPNPLADLAMKVLYGPITPEEYQAFFSVSQQKEHAVEITESLRVVCTAALLYPRIVDDPQADDEIHIDDLEDNEQRFIFDLALMEASTLSRFCRRQETGLEGLATVAEDSRETEPVV